MGNYNLYVDGGGTPAVPTYFSYKCLETQHKNSNPVCCERFYLFNLAYELLPPNCDIFNDEGFSTNNLAEYAALTYGLQRFQKILGHQNVNVYQDSQLVVNQVLGSYRCKQEHLQPWLRYIKNIWWPQINLQWVPREVIVRILGH